MEENGDLYLDRYEGWYSVRDEAYYDEGELVAGEGSEKLSPQGTPVEWTVEESWFFRLSKYQEPLLQLYRDNPEFVRPATRLNEVRSFVEGGLRDLSVSRTSFDWGVKVPGAGEHVMYVWVDALTNYLTGLGYPDDTEDFRTFWPASVHLIGKDIVRFHAVYWPAFLMSAGIALPKQVFAHGFLLNRGQKESKSLGNVTDPHDLADRFGVDPLRYFLLREFTFGQDGGYSPEAIASRANSELANGFGNLAQRTLSLIHKNCDGRPPPINGHDAADNALFELLDKVSRQAMPEAYDSLAFAQALESWMSAVYACNAYIDEQAPWALRKTDPERMQTVLATLYIAIAILAAAASPVMPNTMARLLSAMGLAEDLRTFEGVWSHWYSPLAESGFRLDKPEGLFPRIELPESEAA
jgi:methionyl-tRNA synthetase